MTHQWDEFSKSLAEPVPRRESLRRLGFALAGVVLSPLGLNSAFAGFRDPCKSFCRCRNKSQQNACLSACRTCNKDPSRLAGSCGNYVCCGAGRTSCGGYCADLDNDPYNCGACGYSCDPPGPYEYGACINGSCEYSCVEGAVYCNGTCTLVGWDSNNCGACGNACPGSAPYCNQGVCSVCPPGATLCGGQCIDILSDPANCGACGNVCGGATPYCIQGACTDCATGTICGGACVDLSTDPFNCGACFNACSPLEACAGGTCQGICVGC